MSLSTELLEQARHLVRKERRRPKQASLRRGVSAAYYALFHQLTGASAKFVVAGSGAGREELRRSLRRSYVHGEMKSVSKAFAHGTAPRHWQPSAGSISADLRSVAESFAELQDARHQADYDHGKTWTRQEATDLIERVEQAFAAWERAKDGRDASAYLVALLAKSRPS